MKKKLQVTHYKLRLLKWLFVVVLTGISQFSFATTYYIADNGNDSFSGTEPDSAWKTIGKLNMTTLLPGDSVLFRSGDVFRGQIELTVSGVNGQRIYFGSYDKQNHPVISGAKQISGWTVFSGNIYVTDFPETVSNFFVNGKMMVSARYPNTGFLTIDSSGVNTGLYAASLTQPDDYWANAVLKVRSTDSRYEQTVIQNFNSGWLKFSTPLSNPLDKGYGFYLDHIFSALDTVNEWYYDDVQKKIYFYSITNPNSLTTEGSVYDYGMFASGNSSFMKVEGIDFEMQVKDGIRFNGTSSANLITECGFVKCYSRGINFISSSNDTMAGCKFYSICGQGIKADVFNQSAISNCEFKNIGTVAGYGLEEVNEWDALHLPGTNESLISGNRLDSVGFIGLVIAGKNNRIEENLFRDCALALNSGAAVFMFSSDSCNTTLKNNFIFNTSGNNEATPESRTVADGILLNGQCSYVNILHNTIVNSTRYGININSGSNHNVINDNVIYNSGYAQLYFAETDTVRRTIGNEANNNILYCLNADQQPMLLDGRVDKFNAGTFNSNYYCNPYDYYPVYYFDPDSVTEFVPYSFVNWRSITGGDSQAKKSLVQWQSYSVTDTTGPDLISNGDFSNNFDDWETSDNPNCEMLLDNYTKLDGGCVKFRMLADTPTVWGQLRSNSAFAVSGNEKYQLSFSGLAVKDLNFNIMLQAKTSPYQSLSRYKYFPADTARTDYRDVLQPFSSSGSARIVFGIVYTDSMLWLDNIHLFPVQVNHNDSSRLSRLITNYSSVTANISLGDSVYRDLDGNRVKGSYVLAPFSSYVLTLDSPLTVTSVTPEIVRNDFKLFPNPLNPEYQPLYYSLNIQGGKEKFRFRMFDILGREVYDTEIDNYSGMIRIPAATPSGFYLIRISNSQHSFEKKLILSRGY